MGKFESDVSLTIFEKGDKAIQSESPFFCTMLQLSVPLILASSSPRRIQLLKQIGLSIETQPSNVAEEFNNAQTPSEIVKELAKKKAESVAQTFHRGIIIGADTIVVLEKEILGKPENSAEAVVMLQRLSGKTHTVFTGFALVDVKTKISYIDYEKTEVTFRELTRNEIQAYVKTGSPLDKAGAYGIQDDFGAVFVKEIKGDYYTVVGFPLSKFYTSLKNFTRQLGYLQGEL